MNYFTSKIDTIRDKIVTMQPSVIVSHQIVHYRSPEEQFHSFSTIGEEELYKLVKGRVHFEIKIWYLSAYPKGIQDVGVFFSSVDPILMFLGQTVLVCQSYNGRYRSLSL